MVLTLFKFLDFKWSEIFYFNINLIAINIIIQRVVKSLFKHFNKKPLEKYSTSIKYVIFD